MQVRNTIELVGEPEEVSASMSLIATVLREEAPSEVPAERMFLWTPNTADELVSQITDNARRALTVICENAPQVPFDAVQDALVMDGIATGGVMASIGFALRNMDATNFLSRNYSSRMYLIQPAVASVFLDAIRRYES